jgi:DNA repair protein RecN (Recombination protein N)
MKNYVENMVFNFEKRIFLNYELMRNWRMLKRLYISNFALINEMDVSFPGNLTVITGETGAGKSIFLEALGLALGKRADLSVLRDKSKKCIVEAEFDLKDLDLSVFFEDNDLDTENHAILRREISADGKSRSFFNDTPVNVSALKTLSEKLIDVHSQHQTLLLNQTNFQLELLDAFAQSVDQFKEYKNCFSKITKYNSSLNSLQAQEAQARKELDYYQFLFEELEQSEIKPGTLKELEEESLGLENAEYIKSGLAGVSQAINGGDVNILSALSQVKNTIQSISKFNKKYSDYFERVNSAFIDLKELASEMEDEESTVHFDDKKLEEVNTRLDRLNRLLKKHNVNDENELIRIKTDIEEKLQKFNSLESEILKTTKELNETKKIASKLAEELSAIRQKACKGIEERVHELLSSLSMENARFFIKIKQTNELSATGFDQVKFLFTANKGGELNELQKVASGGELSRLMLSLKALLASKKQLPTIIFDEIDTGVSGDVADKIGNILLKMGRGMQVITITHLPQMASKGGHHLFVYKKDNEDKTVSFIKQLNEEERVMEIAKMLSTGNPSNSAMVNARELLSLN